MSGLDFTLFDFVARWEGISFYFNLNDFYCGTRNGDNIIIT